MVIKYEKVANKYFFKDIAVCCKEMSYYFISQDRPRYCIKEGELAIRYIDLRNGNEIDFCPDCGNQVEFIKL
jgi:hypothetical protein